MNQIHFDPSLLSGKHKAWWEAWHKQALKAADNVMAQAEKGESMTFPPLVWTQLKRWLLMHVFMGKCAYCESKITITDYGAADHYRPKQRVVAKLGTRTSLTTPDGKSEFGYYWVAYDWRNLLPCCNLCNTGGKLDYFPIEGTRVLSPNEAADCTALDDIEQPLLLHPYNGGDNHPRKHLAFGPRGHVKCLNKSEKGKASIIMCDLRREDLRVARKESQENAWNRYEKLMLSKPERERFLQTFKDGKEVHSSAVIDYICFKLDELAADRASLDI